MEQWWFRGTWAEKNQPGDLRTGAVGDRVAYVGDTDDDRPQLDYRRGGAEEGRVKGYETIRVVERLETMADMYGGA